VREQRFVRATRSREELDLDPDPAVTALGRIAAGDRPADGRVPAVVALTTIGFPVAIVIPRTTV
jgi:hypothetical protein